MLSAPILIAIAVGVCVAIGIGLWLSKSSAQSPYQNFGDETPSAESAVASTVPAVLTRNGNRGRFGLSELAKRLGLPQQLLEDHAPTYRIASIPKPSGGVRRLEIPDDSTKSLQRTLLKRLFQALDAHPLACGFEEGASIVDAALPHQNKRVIVKMDIRNFFESTTAERVQKWFEAIGWDSNTAGLLTQLTTNEGHLPQGAPTSPRLSNLINAPLDHALLQLARKHKGHYSRYADDITMSFDFVRGRKLRGLTQVVRRILRSYGYSMHGGRKLRIFRQNQRQQVLGLVVNSKVALPRKTRRWLRAVRHRFDQGKPITITEAQLLGWESLAHMVKTQRDEA